MPLDVVMFSNPTTKKGTKLDVVVLQITIPGPYLDLIVDSLREQIGEDTERIPLPLLVQAAGRYLELTDKSSINMMTSHTTKKV